MRRIPRTDAPGWVEHALTVVLVSGFVAGVYVVVAVGVDRLVGTRVGHDSLSLLAAALVAVGFHPVRQWATRLARRTVRGDRTAPYDVLAGWAREEADDALLRACRLLHGAVDAESVSVWRGDAEQPAATWPPLATPSPRSPHPQRVVAAVVHEGLTLGAVSVTTAGQPSEGDHRLVVDLAHSLGVVLHNDRLTAELRRQVDDLEASRRRLLEAGDDARRAIERALDAAALDRLAMVRLELDRLHAQVDPTDERLPGLLAQVAADTDGASRAVRAFAHGVYPALLATGGLRRALLAEAAHLEVDIAVDVEVGDLPDDVASAVYFVCLEALQNIAKYAEATSVRMRVRDEDGPVRFTIVDDGIGFDPGEVDVGVGMTNMHDRVDALGGSLRVASGPGGTVVEGTIPVDARLAV